MTASPAPGRVRLRALRGALDATTAAVRRFPELLLASLVAAGAAICIVAPGDHPAALRLLAAASLALPLFFVAAILAECRGRLLDRLGMALVIVAGLFLFWYLWPGWTDVMRVERYVQLSLAFHGIAAVAPFARAPGTNGFWQYNKTLLLRAIVTVISAGVLYLGLAIAIAALEQLFDVPMPGETYARLWFVLVFIFGTCYFAGGIPRHLDALQDDTDYPNVLRAFSQFILVPLVAIYLVILTAYLVKVVVTAQWPSGWIGYLVSSVAVVGILSWLLVQPLEERPEYRWVRPFTRGFYLALMPSIVMLWLAIWQRVHQYGITERRYVLVILSVWLAAMAVYYAFSRGRNIKVIPASLTLLALVTFAGPWGMYSVSRRSQAARLAGVLARTGRLIDGKLAPGPPVVSDSDAVAINAGFRYLLETHGIASVRRWLSDSLRRAVGTASDTGGAGVEPTVSALVHAIGVEHHEATPGGAPFNANRYFSAAPLRVPVSITGYRLALRLDNMTSADSTAVAPGVFVVLEPAGDTVRIRSGGSVYLEFPVGAAADSALGARRAGAPNMALEVRAQQGAAAGLLVVTYLNRPAPKQTGRVSSLTGELFVTLP